MIRELKNWTEITKGLYRYVVGASVCYEMTDSILNSIKGLLYIDESEKGFDSDIIMHINSVFMVLNQLGVGPDEGFTISDDSATWSDFIGKDIL